MKCDLQHLNRTSYGYGPVSEPKRKNIFLSCSSDLCSLIKSIYKYNLCWFHHMCHTSTLQHTKHIVCIRSYFFRVVMHCICVKYLSSYMVSESYTKWPKLNYSVSKVTGDRPDISLQFQVWVEIFSFTTTSTSVLSPTTSLTKWVTGPLYLRITWVKCQVTAQLHLAMMSRVHGAPPPHPLHTFRAWWLVTGRLYLLQRWISGPFSPEMGDANYITCQKQRHNLLLYILGWFLPLDYTTYI